VSYVHDGDTLRCSDGTRIRLHAVAAREADGSCSPGHPCPAASAAAATARLRQLAEAHTIQCEAVGRSYDRITAVCWTPAGEEINCAMIDSGVALIWNRFNRQRPICSA
jgi:endonuclease YncB( thermonuclease family)